MLRRYTLADKFTLASGNEAEKEAYLLHLTKIRAVVGDPRKRAEIPLNNERGAAASLATCYHFLSARIA